MSSRLITILDELFRRSIIIQKHSSWRLSCLLPSRLIWLEGELLLLHLPRQLAPTLLVHKSPSFCPTDLVLLSSSSFNFSSPLKHRLNGLSEIKCCQKYRLPSHCESDRLLPEKLIRHHSKLRQDYELAALVRICSITVATIQSKKWRAH
jgi:hypothetical protein